MTSKKEDGRSNLDVVAAAIAIARGSAAQRGFWAELTTAAATPRVGYPED
jgi:hypothetical protein